MVDLQAFRDMNSGPKKASWHQRYAEISKNFKSVERLNWEKVFNDDPEILGSIINDILKLNVPSKGRPGKRPSLQEDQAREMFSTLMGENFTEEPFHVAFRKLSAPASIRELATTFGLDKMLIHRLLNNRQAPTLEQMEQIAVHYHKEPSFFVEWRVAYVVSYLDTLIRQNPDLSVALFKRLKKRK